MRRLLVLIVGFIIWGMGITMFGYNEVMKQPFVISATLENEPPRFYGPFPAWNLPAQVELSVNVPKAPDLKGDACEIKYKWPQKAGREDVFQLGTSIELQAHGETPNSNRGWPTVEHLFYAVGFEHQLRVVRADVVNKWKSMAVPSIEEPVTTLPVIDKEHAKENCQADGAWQSEMSSNSEEFLRQLAGIGDKASNKLAEEVRARFKKLIFEAAFAWLMFVIAVPLAIILIFIFLNLF